MTVELKNVTFGYDGSTILKNINLVYHSSDFLSIIGPNGGGKSSLLRLMLGLIAPLKGSVLIDGKSPKELCKFIGYVPQHIPINRAFPMSVLEIVLMGRLDNKIFGFYSKKDKELAMNALKKVSMQDFYKRGIGELSGGERQRVYIARALCSDAKILMLDEPTASIDTEGQAEIYTRLKDINATGIGIVIVSHDINMAISFASKVAYVSRELFLHSIDGRDKQSFIEHLSRSHDHFCDVEIALKKCGCKEHV
ncbi:ABC transporter ATP-binding protein [Campylobacter fetus]|uniref:Metal ion ABC transporter, ATP-binding protein n=3 Tax=Campylobacter fetus TaxID=196 RepID=A0AAE6MAQ6_CAMFE|nr:MULTISPECIES: ABC transporter ATP-binding protein [Campylobacter]OCS21658.1 ABC transporter [Campylobacter fetus subsp. venerealis cfvi97/532]OCS26617.1 ABC transporter [Campylobacter fetus subsp. venerealis cfvB10]OCS29269.1 ABC transporter [Campylobacter fetus subsp. venerealis LMG 6570 = CCUG 33900]OCS42907.1 ABC transporter [Campylobacter fetus subsp. venerealis cfvi02/298]ABK82518.1 ABC transporter ATP-binding protein [Campylobacter fetus subsp. fetus 82-40]